MVIQINNFKRIEISNLFLLKNNLKNKVLDKYNSMKKKEKNNNYSINNNNNKNKNSNKKNSNMKRKNIITNFLIKKNYNTC